MMPKVKKRLKFKALETRAVKWYVSAIGERSHSTATKFKPRNSRGFFVSGRHVCAPRTNFAH